MDYYYQNFWRLDFGFGNPNLTAALIIQILFASWIFAYLKKGGFWISFGISCVLIPTLFHTYSRGGIVALVFGLLTLAFFAPRPWIGRYRKAIWISFIGFALYTLGINAAHRYALGIAKEDKSITHRLMVWKAIPQMIQDAPQGWGSGKAAYSYMQWYQPLNNNQRFKHLISSHFTWLVEQGWPFRILYVFGWGILILSCWPSTTKPWLSVPLSLWSTFFITALFSATAHNPYLWIIPSLGSFLVFAHYIRERIKPTEANKRGLPWRVMIGGSVGGVLLFIGWIEVFSKPSEIHFSDNIIRSGNTGEKTAILLPDVSVLGELYGKEIRSFRSSNSEKSFWIFLDLKKLNVAENFEKIILSGDFKKYRSIDSLNEQSNLVLFSPRGNPEQIQCFRNRREVVRVISGEFDQEFDTAQFEKEIFQIEEVDGNTKYIKKWIKY